MELGVLFLLLAQDFDVVEYFLLIVALHLLKLTLCGLFELNKNLLQFLMFFKGILKESSTVFLCIIQIFITFLQILVIHYRRTLLTLAKGITESIELTRVEVSLIKSFVVLILFHLLGFLIEAGIEELIFCSGLVQTICDVREGIHGPFHFSFYLQHLLTVFQFLIREDIQEIGGLSLT